MQSPFFNKIKPLGICETALWTIKCLRMFIKRKTADLRNHLAQQLRVFQHGARAQVVLVERPAIVVRHEERRLQDFEQCFFADVGIGIVDEHARVGVAAGVDIQVYAELFALRDGRNYRENKSSALDLLMRIIRTGTGLHECRFGRPQSGSGHRRNSRYRRHSR